MQDENFLLPVQVSGSLSIDRVTFLVWSPTLSAWCESVKEYKDNMNRIERFDSMLSELPISWDDDFSQGSRSELFLHHYRTAKIDEGEGIDLQFGAVMPVRKRIKDVKYIDTFGSDEDKEAGYIDTYFPTHYGLRVEYNPNKDSIKTLSCLFRHFSRLVDFGEMIRFARLDIAIDYPFKLVPELVLCNNSRKYSYAGGSSGVETVYFGSRASQFMFRIYDKKRELMEQQGKEISLADLWRVELECKKPFFISCVPDFKEVFERLSFYDGASSSGDWLLDIIRSQAMQYGLKSVLSKMPSRTQARYRSQLKDFSLSCDRFESPSSVYSREFPSAFSSLRNDILSAFQSLTN